MQPSTNLFPKFDSSDLESDPTFNVVIAYEDFETGKNAKRTYDYLVAQLGHDCQFSSQMWKFDVLNIPKLREMAAREAVTADIVIISCHGENPLPAEVKAWMELWLGEAQHPVALVALFDSPPGFTVEAMALRNYLADVARRGQMEFFAQPEDWPKMPPLMPLPHPAHLPQENRAVALAGMIHHETAFPRWGINE